MANASSPEGPGGGAARPVTTASLAAMKGRTPIACLTAYDHVFARACARAGVDVLLVGDTLGEVIQGARTTLPVTVDDIIYHTRCVASGSEQSLVVADMPFMSYPDVAQGLANAGRLMKEGGAHMVKLEGGAEQSALVEQLSQHGIPVCGHLGLKPQHVYKLGGYRVQGRSAEERARMEEDARTLEEAGADLLLVECIPASFAAHLAGTLSVPVIGIGAGPGCDGQILVLHDALGLTEQPPRFVKDFSTEGIGVRGALTAYVEAVRERRFPAPEHGFGS